MRDSGARPQLHEYQLQYITTCSHRVEKWLWLDILRKQWGNHIEISGNSEPPYKTTVSILSDEDNWRFDIARLRRCVKEAVLGEWKEETLLGHPVVFTDVISLDETVLINLLNNKT